MGAPIVLYLWVLLDYQGPHAVGERYAATICGIGASLPCADWSPKSLWDRQAGRKYPSKAKRAENGPNNP